MDIEELIKEFLDYILKEEFALEDLSELMAALDKLAFSVNFINYEFDENEYPEPPENNYQLIREKVQKRFPNLGFYNTSQDVSENLEKSALIVLVTQ